MKKEILFVIIAVVVVVLSSISLIVFLNQGGIGIDPEKKKYAEFNAEIACNIFEVESLSDLTDMVNHIQDTMDDYGYTEEEVYELRDKYEGDEEFADALVEALEDECPERIDEFDLDEYFDSLDL